MREARYAIALTIAKAMPGWSEGTDRISQMVNEECIRQGCMYADAILAEFDVTPKGPTA